MKRKIKDVEKSPFNNVYFIILECGHRVTRRRLSRYATELNCPECAQSNNGLQPTAKSAAAET